MNIKEKSSGKNFLTGMKKILAIVLAGMFPIITLAATASTVTQLDITKGVGGLFDLSSSFLNRAVFFIITLAIVYFVWEVFQYTIAGDEAKKKEAKDGIVWGIIGIFVMVSIWGLVAILQYTFSTGGVTSSNVTDSLKNELPKFSN